MPLKVIAVNPPTPDQCKQLTLDLLEFFYQAHRQAERGRLLGASAPSASGAVESDHTQQYDGSVSQNEGLVDHQGGNRVLHRW